MRISSYSLRLQPSLMEEAREVARSEGVSLNQLFNVAVAEKLATVRTERGFKERIRRAGRWELHFLRLGERDGPGERRHFLGQRCAIGRALHPEAVLIDEPAVDSVVSVRKSGSAGAPGGPLSTF